QQRARAGAAEASPKHGGRGEKPEQPEAGHAQRMPRQSQRSEEICEQRVRLAQERCEEPPVRLAVLVQVARSVVERASQEHGRLAIERVRQGRGRTDPAKTVRVEIEAAEEG